MQTFQIGQHVTLASMPDCIFVIAEMKVDGSYVVETLPGSSPALRYDNVSAEMLKTAASGVRA